MIALVSVLGSRAGAYPRALRLSTNGDRPVRDGAFDAQHVASYRAMTRSRLMKTGRGN